MEADYRLKFQVLVDLAELGILIPRVPKKGIRAARPAKVATSLTILKQSTVTPQ